MALMGFEQAPTQSAFNADESQKIVQYWATKVKYEAHPAGEIGSEWCVRLTPAGSKWIREMYRQFQTGKVVPTQDPSGFSPEQKQWTAWLDRQVQRDWADAEVKAANLNQNGYQRDSAGGGVKPVAIETKLDRKVGTDKIGRLDPAPNPQADDPCPATLVALIGPAPRFAAPVCPLLHTVTFPDGLALVYTDNVKVRQKYAYYRFADGVNSEGESVKTLPDSDMASLFKAAHISAPEQKVMKAVSLLEGGFDSINTYDTGFVSVGFIQFACLADGTGSLGAMMASYKANNPKGFQTDFRQYGIDTIDNRLVALDLETGAEKVGADAALQIIHDKRLIAVFQRAGLKSQDFRVAQLQAAKKQFYPANDVVTVCLNGTTCQVKVCDVFKTEAGMATLMDRKVNTGKLAGLKENIERIAAENGIQNPADLPDIEYSLTRAMAYRQDYTLSASLSKPRDNTAGLSRKGSRSGRGDAASAGGGSRKGGSKRKST